MELTKEQCCTLREKHVCETVNCHMWYRDNPIRMVRAAGQYIFDEDGNKYLDCINNTSHVGHCHRDVVEAASKQLGTLSTNHRFLYDKLPKYCKRLSDTMPSELSVCLLVNSGSEANDVAIRLARKFTGRFDIAVLENGYHGQTVTLNELRPSGVAYGRDQAEYPSHVHTAAMPDSYRGKYRDTDYTSGELLDKYVAEVEEMFQRAHKGGKEIAAFLMEPLPSPAGQITPPKGYLRNAMRIVKKYGAVFIADEAQTGFGRVGKHWWAFQLEEDVVPDIVTMGKGMGNSHPIGGLITTPEIGAALSGGRAYFNTFGGNPVSCAIGLAVMDVIEKENLVKRAANVGDYFMKRLLELKKTHRIIGDVRGSGLFVGIDLVKDQTTREPATEEAIRLVNRLKEEKVILSKGGPFENVLKFKPPMCFNESNADFLIEKLDLIFAEFSSE